MRPRLTVYGASAEDAMANASEVGALLRSRARLPSGTPGTRRPSHSVCLEAWVHVLPVACQAGGGSSRPDGKAQAPEIAWREDEETDRDLSFEGCGGETLPTKPRKRKMIR